MTLELKAKDHLNSEANGRDSLHLPCSLTYRACIAPTCLEDLLGFKFRSFNYVVFVCLLGPLTSL